MSVASRNPTVYWCEPIHHNPEGPTDPDHTTLNPNFTAVIIGSSRGIGRATALAYARAGAAGIVLTGRTQETLSAAVEDVKNVAKHKSVVVKGILCDVCNDDDLQELASEVQKEFGKVDALVINAGVATVPITRPDGTEDWPRDVKELDLADFKRTFDVNFFAVVSAMKFFLPLLEDAGKQDWPSPQAVIVVTSSSIHHFDPKLMAMGYSLSKFAAARMSEYVHEGHRERGVCAYAIQPGSVMTDMAKNDLPKGKGWEKILIDDVGLGGGFCVWLTKERRDWLSGRWLDARWDVEELLRRREDILAKDLLKFRMTM